VVIMLQQHYRNYRNFRDAKNYKSNEEFAEKLAAYYMGIGDRAKCIRKWKEHTKQYSPELMKIIHKKVQQKFNERSLNTNINSTNRYQDNAFDGYTMDQISENTHYYRHNSRNNTSKKNQSKKQKNKNHYSHPNHNSTLNYHLTQSNSGHYQYNKEVTQKEILLHPVNGASTDLKRLKGGRWRVKKQHNNTPVTVGTTKKMITQRNKPPQQGIQQPPQIIELVESNNNNHMARSTTLLPTPHSNHSNAAMALSVPTPGIMTSISSGAPLDQPQQIQTPQPLRLSNNSIAPSSNYTDTAATSNMMGVYSSTSNMNAANINMTSSQQLLQMQQQQLSRHNNNNDAMNQNNTTTAPHNYNSMLALHQTAISLGLTSPLLFTMSPPHIYNTAANLTPTIMNMRHSIKTTPNQLYYSSANNKQIFFYCNPTINNNIILSQQNPINNTTTPSFNNNPYHRPT